MESLARRSTEDALRAEHSAYGGPGFLEEHKEAGSTTSAHIPKRH